MSNSPRLKRPGKTRKIRTLTRLQLAEWLDSLDPPAAGISQIDGYLTALVVSPQFIR